MHLGGFGTGDAEDFNFELRKECWKRSGGSMSLFLDSLLTRARHTSGKGPDKWKALRSGSNAQRLKTSFSS